jgi:protein-S-isoprenylcysteine O-methyltransferase Ste14
MKLKGIQKFLEKIPDFRGKKLLYIPLILIPSFLLPLLIMVFLDISTRIWCINEFGNIIEPIIPISSTLLFQFIGIFLISRIWVKKEDFLKKYNEKAYQKSFKFVLTGIPIFITSMLHGFIPFEIFYQNPSKNLLSWIMAKPLSFFIFGLEDPTLFLRFFLGLFILIIGIGTVLRSLDTFGFDYMSIIYIYYPEESEIQDHEIFSILRHPTYHGLILISFSSIMFRFSFYSIIISILFILGMNTHLKLIEEKELKERFGEKYRQYMKETNALFYHPRLIRQFFKFLLGKNSKE